MKPVVHVYAEKRGQSWEPTLVAFCQVDVNRSFLRFLDFRSSCPLFCREGGPQDGVSQKLVAIIIGKMSGVPATRRSNGKKCESNGKMTETTKRVYGEATGRSDESIVAICSQWQVPL